MNKVLNKPLDISETERFKFDYNRHWSDVPMNDPAVWTLYQRGDVKGIFQVESNLCREWCKKIAPNCIEDLAALVSLVRPGGLESGMAEKFANIKNGNEEPSYIHESLRPILEPTYSCLVYQEQIIRIATDIAGLNESQADILRRAIGKKDPKQMSEAQQMLLTGFKEKCIVDQETGQQICDWIQKSVRYLFNAAHAYSYAFTSYFTEYQKLHCMTEFYTAALVYSGDKPDPKQEIFELVNDAKLHNITILPPDIRYKNKEFVMEGPGKIRFGIASTRSVADKVFQKIAELPNEAFDSFHSLLYHGRKIPRHVFEALIKSGACDYIGRDRSLLLKTVHVVMGRGDNDDKLLEYYKNLSEVESQYLYSNILEKGVPAILQEILDNNICVKKRRSVIQSKIEFLRQGIHDSNRIKYTWEKIYLGHALTCSAADDVDKIDHKIISCKDLVNADRPISYTIHCVIEKILPKKTGPKSKNPGQEYAYIVVSDGSAAIERIIVWPKTFEKFNDQILENAVVTIYGQKNYWNDQVQFVANKIILLD